MALALQPAAAPWGAPRIPRWFGPVVALALCGGGVVALVPPALAAVGPLSDPRPVSVRIDGRVSTAGLPSVAAVSMLTVRNDGTVPLSWSARPVVEGAGASGVLVQAWAPVAPTCASVGTRRVLATTDWSEPLEPGATVRICVRVSADGTATGPATPSVTVVARPA